jgi:hypothetical protein
VKCKRSQISSGGILLQKCIKWPGQRRFPSAFSEFSTLPGIANTANDQYTRVAPEEDDKDNSHIEKGGEESECEGRFSLKNCVGMFAVAGIFAIGFVVGRA